MMVRWIVITVLTVGIVGTAFWGYQEHKEKNAILIQAENTYQRSFHELSYHVDLLHDKIGTALAMNSDTRLSPQLVEIWRLTSDALSNVGQLPLSLLPFNKTEEFLSNIGDFSYRAAVRNLSDKPLSNDETKTLKNLYKQSGEIKDELRQVQHLVLKNNLRWMDVQLALANQDEQQDNTIIDGLKTVENKVDGYAKNNMDTPIGNSVKEHKFKNIDAKKISQKEALNIGKQLFRAQRTDQIKLTNSGKGADIPLYSLSYDHGDVKGYMDITQQGGHPLSLLINRPINGRKISLNEGLEKAEQYLEKNGFDNMTLFQSNQYDDIGVYSFLYDDDGVRIYADAVDVKVALDNGDVVGLTARDYFMNHIERDIPKPGITVEDAKDKVNDNVRIEEEYLAVIDNDLGEEVLTYEFLGIMNDDTYRIFINANDGTEEKVERLGGNEITFASAF